MKPTECKSNMGLVIGLVDALITIGDVLAPMLDLEAMRLGVKGDRWQPIRDALKDLNQSSGLMKILEDRDSNAMRLIHRAAELLEARQPPALGGTFNELGAQAECLLCRGTGFIYGGERGELMEPCVCKGSD